MPYVTGGTLQERLGRGPLSQDEIPPVLRQVAEALDFAHERGIVHRDVKPTNLLLDDRGQLYLADFGIAKALEGAGDLTGKGVGVGTPQYMAPEQAQGRAEARSDLYAVGVILYQMLTGRVPYTGQSYAEILLKHVREPLPLAPLRDVTPPLPGEIDAVLQRALAKAPDDRYPTGRALAEAVTNALTTGTVKVDTPLPPAQPPAGPPRAEGDGRTRRLLLIAGFAGVVVLLLLAVGLYLR
jgi:serine/threonine protein kinase